MNGPTYEKVAWAFVAYVVWLGAAMYVVGHFDLAVDALRRVIDRRRAEGLPLPFGSRGKAGGHTAFPRVLRSRRYPAG